MTWLRTCSTNDGFWDDGGAAGRGGVVVMAVVLSQTQGYVTGSRQLSGYCYHREFV